MSAFSSKNYHETSRADRPSKESEEKSQSAPEDHAHYGNSKRYNKDSHNGLLLIVWNLVRQFGGAPFECYQTRWNEKESATRPISARRHQVGGRKLSLRQMCLEGSKRSSRTMRKHFLQFLYKKRGYAFILQNDLGSVRFHWFASTA